MMLADVTFSTEGLTVIAALVTSLAGCVTVLFKLLMSAKDREIVDLTCQRDTYQKMTKDAIEELETKINEQLHVSGKAEIVSMADVLPEHNSPVTETQDQAAKLATLRARIVACQLILRQAESGK